MAAVAVMQEGVGDVAGKVSSGSNDDHQRQARVSSLVHGDDDVSPNGPADVSVKGHADVSPNDSNSDDGSSNVDRSSRPPFRSGARASNDHPLNDSNKVDEPVKASGSMGSPHSHANRSFSDVVGNRVKPKVTFYPLNNKKDSVVEIPFELAQEASKPFHTTAYGYFLGPRVYFPIVERTVKAAWGKYGCSEVMLNGNGTYFFKFNDVGGRDHVVETGPLMIRGVPLFVFPWDANKGIRIPEHVSCPLWVKLHNIPLVAFNLEGICRIASAIGEPRQLDACTAAMCDKLWGRTGFAKVLIDVWALGELKREVEVVIPSLSGGPSDRIKVKVEYIWEPSQCTDCCVFGHTIKSCPKKPIQKRVNKGKEHEDRDGFVPVVKKQRKKKPIHPNVNVEESRNGQAGGASASHTAVKENITKPLDPKPFDDGPKVAKVIGKGKEKAEGNLAGANSNGTGFRFIKVDGKTKTTDGQGEGVKHTPGPIPFYQSVLKSF